MSTAYHSLRRLREYARQESGARLTEARAACAHQQERLASVQRAVGEARVGTNPEDLLSLATWHAFRLRQELVERREAARLAQRQRDLDLADTCHAGRVRDELALQAVIDAAAAEAVLALRHAETRTLDEIGARMRWLE